MERHRNGNLDFGHCNLVKGNSEGDAQRVFGRGRISGHGEKCGEWAKFAMIFEQAVEVMVLVSGVESPQD